MQMNLCYVNGFFVHCEQGDQIGRILASEAIADFGENYSKIFKVNKPFIMILLKKVVH
jgi:hypothetical protein